MSILPAVHRYVREALAIINRHHGNKYRTRVEFAHHVVACVQCGRRYHVTPRRLKVISEYRCRDDGKPLKYFGEIIIK